MKKLIALLFSLIFIMPLVGCVGETYELSHDQFCYSESNGSVVDLELREKEYVIELLNNGDWYGEVAKCPSNYRFYTKSQSIGYNLDEGIFNDFTLKRSLKISDKDRTILNGYLNN